MLGALSRCSGTPSSRNLNNNALARRTRHRHGASHRARSHTTCPAALPGSAMDFLTLQPYTPPAWASHLSLVSAPHPTSSYTLPQGSCGPACHTQGQHFLDHPHPVRLGVSG